LNCPIEFEAHLDRLERTNPKGCIFDREAEARRLIESPIDGVWLHPINPDYYEED
jgi:hypothetical protein